MPPKCRRPARRALRLLVLCSLCSASIGRAQEPPAAAPWEGPAFSADPAALLKAAAAIPAGDDSSVVVLTDEIDWTFDAAGRRDIRHRLVYRVATAAGVKNWASYDESWPTWYQEKPVLRARVVTPDGHALDLDPATIADSPAGSSSPDTYTDRRTLRAPLPGVAVGAVVEQETIVKETKPLFDAGVVKYVFFGLSAAPVRHIRLDLTYPKALDLRFLVRTQPSIQPRRSEENGLIHLRFEAGPLAAMDFSEVSAPPDRERYSYVALSTGGSWSKVARRYGEIVEQQIAGADLAEPAAEAKKNGAKTPEVIARLLARLQRDVRYTGVEFSDASIVPRPPAETLKRRYGDCKDKAALLVAMLRASGIPASVALLRSGSSLDSEPELAGLGFFDHAIVYVPGPPAFWIDPTDEFARAGELPLSDRGRLALIVSPGSDRLVSTPESVSAGNEITETRNFFLQEFGPARAEVIVEARGSFERAYRRLVHQTDKKKLDEFFERYVRAALYADGSPKTTLSDPLDLQTPMRIVLQLDSARRGQTDDSAAVVAILMSPLAESFPSIFRESSETKPGKGSNASAPASKPRTHDYVFAEPAVYDWIYHIVPPSGYAAAALPENNVTGVGTGTLSRQFVVEKDGTVTVRLRIDTGKTRISPQEFADLREAVRKLQAADTILVRFDSKGQALLASGKMREALAEFRELSCKHPKEATHRIQTANALLAAGLGLPAREEARRAIALDPVSARAYRTLAWVLQHDDLGRRFGPGFDRKGALEAYAKALELEPSDVDTRANEALLLEYDDRGDQYAPGANLEEAIKQYRALRTEWKESRFDDRLLLALIWAKRFPEVLEAARDASTSDTRAASIILATAATRGPDAAIQDAAGLIGDAEKRRKAILEAAETLFQLRLYEPGVALLRHAASGASNAAELQARAEVFGRARRFEELPAGEGPTSLVNRFIAAGCTARSDEPQKILSLFSPRVAGEAFEPTGSLSVTTMLEAMQRPFRKQGFPLAAAADIVIASSELAVEGNDDRGYRVRVVGSPAGDPDSLYLIVREDGKYRLVATNRNLWGAGRQALWLADKGDLVSARQWLDWARDELSQTPTDDPFVGTGFAMYWPKGSAGDARSARRAAASLLAMSPGAPAAIEVFRADREAASAAERALDDWGLALAYIHEKRWADALASVEPLAEAHPESETVFRARSTALVSLHRFDEARRLAEDQLRRSPDQVWTLRVLADLSAYAGDLAGYQKFYRRVSQTGKAESIDFNNLAWMTLFTGDPDGQGKRDALRAVEMSQHNDPSSIHTLATVYAEKGRTGEARETGIQVLALQEPVEPDSSIWCVFGRIAESYGEVDTARAFYERVKPPETPEAERWSAHALAKKHLESLAKAKDKSSASCDATEPGAATARSGS